MHITCWTKVGLSSPQRTAVKTRYKHVPVCMFTYKLELRITEKSDGKAGNVWRGGGRGKGGRLKCESNCLTQKKA